MFINLKEIEILLKNESLYRIHKECNLNKSMVYKYGDGRIPLKRANYETLEKLQKYVNKLKKDGIWYGQERNVK